MIKKRNSMSLINNAFLTKDKNQILIDKIDEFKN